MGSSMSVCGLASKYVHPYVREMRSILDPQHHGSLVNMLHDAYGSGLNTVIAEHGLFLVERDAQKVFSSEQLPSKPAKLSNENEHEHLFVWRNRPMTGQDWKVSCGADHKQTSSLLSSVGTMMRCRFPTQKKVFKRHFYHKGHGHSVSILHCRSLCTMSSQENDEPRHETVSNEGCKLDEEEAWKKLAVQMQSLQKKLAKGEALTSLKASVDYLEPFASLGDLRYGAACLRLAQSLLVAKEEPESFICYAQRALESYESFNESLEHAQCLSTLGFAYFDMNELENAVVHLEKCVLVLQHVKEPIRNECCNSLQFNVQHSLARAKAFLEKFDEALPHYEHLIKIGEKSMKHGDPRLAACYLEAGIVSRKLSNFNAALGFSIKGFEGHMARYGPSSLQVANARAVLVGVYTNLGRYDDALHEYEEARPVLEYLGQMEMVDSLGLDVAKLLIGQKKYRTALSKILEVVNGSKRQVTQLIRALILAAKASHALNDKENAAYYCKTAHYALCCEKPSITTAANLLMVGLRYEEQAQYNQAATVLKQALVMMEQYPYTREQSYINGRLGQLLVQSGKVKEALPFLEKSLLHEEHLSFDGRLTAHMYLGITFSSGTQRQSEGSKHLEAANLMFNLMLKERKKASWAIGSYKKLAVMHGLFGSMGAFELLYFCSFWLMR